MREPVKDKLRLEHILGAIDVLLEGRSKYTFEQAVSDPIVFYGFVKHVEIIGEATYMLSKQFKQTHTEVDWNVIEGMRHVLVHGYYQILPNRLWDTVDTDIEPLRPIIQSLYDNEI
ncbi:MAG: DUF86 domain-containing protein [Bacteroidaceae bacterium]|nr:DUF86 domain-containing protein [Bacteroidaceae bacterium]